MPFVCQKTFLVLSLPPFFFCTHYCLGPNFLCWCLRSSMVNMTRSTCKPASSCSCTQWQNAWMHVYVIVFMVVSPVHVNSSMIATSSTRSKSSALWIPEFIKCPTCAFVIPMTCNETSSKSAIVYLWECLDSTTVPFCIIPSFLLYWWWWEHHFTQPHISPSACGSKTCLLHKLILVCESIQTQSQSFPFVLCSSYFMRI